MSEDETSTHWARFEALKDALPLLLPASSALGWGIIRQIFDGKVIIGLTALLPPQLTAFWLQTAAPVWILLTAGCSTVTIARYLHGTSTSRTEAFAVFTMLVPMVFAVHFVVTLVLAAVFGIQILD